MMAERCSSGHPFSTFDSFRRSEIASMIWWEVSCRQCIAQVMASYEPISVTRTEQHWCFLISLTSISLGADGFATTSMRTTEVPPEEDDDLQAAPEDVDEEPCRSLPVLTGE